MALSKWWSINDSESLRSWFLICHIHRERPPYMSGIAELSDGIKKIIEKALIIQDSKLQFLKGNTWENIFCTMSLELSVTVGGHNSGYFTFHLNPFQPSLSLSFFLTKPSLPLRRASLDFGQSRTWPVETDFIKAHPLAHILKTEWIPILVPTNPLAGKRQSNLHSLPTGGVPCLQTGSWGSTFPVDQCSNSNLAD